MTHPLVSRLTGTPFAKMTGSGNDFVVFDARDVDGQLVTRPEVIQAICNRHNGIGADGIVLIEPKPDGADARIHYFNSDGSAADLCGNATLCSTAMAVELELGSADALSLWTDAGLIHSRISQGTPEIDLEPVRKVSAAADIELEAGEIRIGFAVAGVPHLVVLCDDVAAIDVARRGAQLRRHPWTGPPGANVNFVSRRGDVGWRYRTFERGVEGETLACGTGSIAAAILLVTWNLDGSPVELWTSSGRMVTVTLNSDSAAAGAFRPSLRGEGRVVFRGIIGEISHPV
ncbi:MAG: diaminopimelate epimerase [Phycisphaerae bacterium]|nr:diaminopimelate epimerase [Gemmatimonadaceae bacterium]